VGVVEHAAQPFGLDPAVGQRRDGDQLGGVRGGRRGVGQRDREPVRRHRRHRGRAVGQRDAEQDRRRRLDQLLAPARPAGAVAVVDDRGHGAEDGVGLRAGEVLEHAAPFGLR
jgi:hypothetical protein